MNKIERTTSKKPQKNLDIVTSPQPATNESITSERGNKTLYNDFDISNASSFFNSPINQDINKKCKKMSQPTPGTSRTLQNQQDNQIMSELKCSNRKYQSNVGKENSVQREWREILEEGYAGNIHEEGTSVSCVN